MTRDAASETLGAMVKELGLTAVLNMIARGVEYKAGNEESCVMADALERAADAIDDIVIDLETAEETEDDE